MYTALAAFETKRKSTALPSGNSRSLGRIESASATKSNGILVVTLNGTIASGNVRVAVDYERRGNDVIVRPQFSVMSGSIGTSAISQFSREVSIDDIDVAGVESVIIQDNDAQLQIPTELEVAVSQEQQATSDGGATDPALVEIDPGVANAQRILSKLPANSTDVAVQKIAAIKIKQAYIARQAINSAIAMVPELSAPMQEFIQLPPGIRRVIAKHVLAAAPEARIDVFESILGKIAEKRAGMGEYFAYGDPNVWSTEELTNLLKNPTGLTATEKSQIEYALKMRAQGITSTNDTSTTQTIKDIVGIIAPLAQTGLQIYQGLTQQEAAQKTAEQQAAYQQQLLAMQQQMTAAQAALAKQVASVSPTVTTIAQASTMASTAATDSFAKIKAQAVKYLPYAAAVGVAGVIGWFFLRGKKNAPQA